MPTTPTTPTTPTPPTTRVLHAALPEDWARAHADGSYDVSTRGVALAEADFVHASTPAQLPATLAAFYADVPAVDVLVLDVAVLEHEGAPVRWEAVPGHDAPFPHVYGVLPVQAVVDVVRVEHEPGTAWTLPSTLAVGGPYDG